MQIIPIADEFVGGPVDVIVFGVRYQIVGCGGDGGSDAVLIDFDAARIYKDESESDTQVLGTTGFAAPEQYGIFQSDERADIFSLGVLLNIMLTGKHPSREMTAGKMGRIVRKCTMTAPEQRYQSARALMEVL